MSIKDQLLSESKKIVVKLTHFLKHWKVFN
ncbi:hypothetical protein 65p082 [Aeromonas phage 65]|uniref:Uncharacterized protein n=1 Tax=Aeromonas phage 65 TaxID=2919549 RepID=E5DRR8_9CAUD|nr:hypothetical protein ST65p082 [Aeromonas phage 65]ADQ53092.1 hypothetical protein 65p082 [Aeromonas phage 65]